MFMKNLAYESGSEVIRNRLDYIEKRSQYDRERRQKLETKKRIAAVRASKRKKANDDNDQTKKKILIQ